MPRHCVQIGCALIATRQNHLQLSELIVCFRHRLLCLGDFVPECDVVVGSKMPRHDFFDD